MFHKLGNNNFMNKLICIIGLLMLISCQYTELNNKIALLNKQHIQDSIHADSLKQKLSDLLIKKSKNKYTIDTFEKKDKVKRNLKRDTLYTSFDNEVYVLGDEQSKQINDILTYFSASHVFSDFKTDSIYYGKKAILDLKSNPLGTENRTVISRGYNSTNANFAGHYILVYWGCGSPCKESVIVDVKTGKIYECPSAAMAYEYKVDSRVLIVNPPDWGSYYSDCAGCQPELYIFDEKSKKFIGKTYIKND